MGAVYRARHRHLGTLHAVKVIRPELVGSKTARDLFVQEARVLRDLRHEAIVQYDGLFQDESDRVYLVMEFAEGKRLADVLPERGSLAEPDVWKLYGRLARGLAAAHARGVVHRDLSPDNIILPEGRAESAKIIDFGIAQVSQAGAHHDAKTEGFAGKFGFAAPEQLGAFGGTVGPPADIYAAGLVLAAAALGAPAADGRGSRSGDRRPQASAAAAAFDLSIVAGRDPTAPRSRSVQAACSRRAHQARSGTRSAHGSASGATLWAVVARRRRARRGRVDRRRIVDRRCRWPARGSRRLVRPRGVRAAATTDGAFRRPKPHRPSRTDRVACAGPACDARRAGDAPAVGRSPSRRRRGLGTDSSR